jgi:hypothetical protein
MPWRSLGTIFRAGSQDAAWDALTQAPPPRAQIRLYGGNIGLGTRRARG